MESKTWSISKDKIDKEVEIRSHFGWKEVTRTPSTLTMSREETPNSKKIRALEKQYNYLKKKFPVAALVWILLGAALIVTGIILKGKWNMNFIFTLCGGIMVAIGLFLLVMFLVTIKYKKKLIEDILDQADEYGGKQKNVPIGINLKQGDKNSYEIKKAVYNGSIGVKQ